MLLPLQTRPDLTLIVLVGVIALIVFFVKMAQDVQRGVQEPTSGERRSVIESLIAIAVTLFLLAYTLPDAITTMEEDDSNEIDDFEDGSLSEWSNVFTDWTTVSDGTAYSGDVYASSALAGNAGGIESLPGDGLLNYYERGETFRTYVRQPNALDGRLWVWFGLGDLLNDGYYTRVEFTNGSLRLVEEDGGVETKIAEDTTVAYSADTWYELKVQWTESDEFTVTLTDTTDGSVVTTLGPVTNSNANLEDNRGVGLYKDPPPANGGNNPVHVDNWGLVEE